MEILLQIDVPRRASRAVVLGAAVAIGSSLAACGDTSERDVPSVPVLAASISHDADHESELVAVDEEETLSLDADEGRLETFEASPGFTPDPLIHEGTTAGGPIDGHDEDDRCHGWLAPEPDFVFTAHRPFAELAVMVASEEDTTLFVVGPDGEPRCGDDDDGVQPMVRGLFTEGTHRVWVGTSAPDVTAHYLLALSELEESRPSRLLH
jgi:hypothetical protein